MLLPYAVYPHSLIAIGSAEQVHRWVSKALKATLQPYAAGSFLIQPFKWAEAPTQEAIDHLVLHPAGITLIDSHRYLEEIDRLSQRRGAVSSASTTLFYYELLCENLARRAGRFREFLIKNANAATQARLEALPIDFLFYFPSRGVLLPSTMPKAWSSLSRLNKKISVSCQSPAVWTIGNRSQLANFLRHPLHVAGPDEEKDAPKRPPVSVSYIEPLLHNKRFFRWGLAKPHYRACCRTCSADRLTVVYAKGGYAFQCHLCGKRAVIDIACQQCGDRLGIRRLRKKSFTYCSRCRCEALLHTEENNGMLF